MAVVAAALLLLDLRVLFPPVVWAASGVDGVALAVTGVLGVTSPFDASPAAVTV